MNNTDKKNLQDALKYVSEHENPKFLIYAMKAFMQHDETGDEGDELIIAYVDSLISEKEFDKYIQTFFKSMMRSRGLSEKEIDKEFKKLDSKK